MPTGTVKWFNATKGYGFIEPEDGFYKDDKGLRIDLVFGNAAVVRRLQCARIDRGRGGKSDHAPVVVDLA